jgi:hypothetical protein
MRQNEVSVREQVLTRLWEIANLSPEVTRSSISGQIKALSMIVAMQNLLPDGQAVSSEKPSAPAPKPGQPVPSVSDPDRWFSFQKGSSGRPN